MELFTTTLKTEQIGRWKHRLIADLVFEYHGRTYVVPAGFVTDFASIRVLHNVVLFVLFALVAGYGNYAATLHDWLYSRGELTRKQCDRLFYRALRDEGIARWRAGLFYAGVRLGGWLYFRPAP